MRYVPLGLTWRDPGHLPLARIERELLRWDGTPYRLGQCLPGVGTYCTAFVVSVLDALYRLQRPTPLPEGIPDDAAMHDPPRARQGLRWFLRQYPAHRQVEDGSAEPGDVLVTGPHGGGPGHGILVGPHPNTLWQCSGNGVHFTGMSIPDTYQLFAVYRMTDRQKWL